MLNSKSRVMIVGALTLVGLCLLVFATPVQQAVQAQQPTGSIPTVTGTPSGVIVAVYQDQQQVTVYAGPSSYLYPAVGLVLAGQELPAYGISEDQTYIQVYYPAFLIQLVRIYAPYVKIVKNGVSKNDKVSTIASSSGYSHNQPHARSGFHCTSDIYSLAYIYSASTIGRL
ncbi:MAG: hypothetical protein U0Z26_09845 [Anaerolineales bacterium]